MSGKADFSDLLPRVLSAIVMLALGAGSLWVGGDVFALVLIIAAGLMGWEMSRMHCVNHLVPMVFGLLIAAVTLCFMFLPLPWVVATAVIAAGAALVGHQRRPVAVLLMGIVIVLACTAFQVLREGNAGFVMTLWLVLVVVATDIGGYFAGKLIGGPKIWARISPKKTWSGTLGGWVLAALVGMAFYANGVGTVQIAAFSVLVAMASQAADMAESAIKRQAGVKDSSNLIPGHGGLLDRFDGWLGAGLLVWVLRLIGAV